MGGNLRRSHKRNEGDNESHPESSTTGSPSNAEQTSTGLDVTKTDPVMRAPKTAAKVSRFASDATNTSSAPGRSRVSAGLPKDSGIASDPASLLSSGPKTGRTISETGPTSAGPDTRGQYQEYYGIDIDTPGEAAHLQRLEQSNTLETVRGWADEGMPVEAMGTPSKMQAFRQRKGTPVPWNVERQNERSVQRSTRAAEDSSPAGETQVPDSVRNVISSPGQPLEPAIQRAMENRMGDSFSDVQIHSGPRAAQAADDINARAFTVGNNIAFNSGEYEPGSAEGQHVLAHELTHVRQQTGGAVSMLPQDDAELEIDPDPKLEREAEATAQRVMSGGELGIQRAQETDIHVQRMPIDNLLTHGIVKTPEELTEKLRQGEDASQYIPAEYLPVTGRKPKRGEERESDLSPEAAAKYAARFGIETGTDKKTGETVTRVNGKKIILKPAPIPEKRKEASAKDESDIAAHKAAYAREEAKGSTGIKKLFKNLAADWHEDQQKKYEKKRAKYEDKEAAKQAADAAARTNAQNARDHADAIRAKARETRDPNEFKRVNAAEQIAAQAAERDRMRRSMRGKVERANDKVRDIEKKLQEIDKSPVQVIDDSPVLITDEEVWQDKIKEAQRAYTPKFKFSQFGNKEKEYEQREKAYINRYQKLLKSPETKEDRAKLMSLKENIIHIRSKRKSLIESKLMAAITDARHPYGPDQGSQAARILPTINNRERAFADTDMDGTAWERKYQSPVRGRKNILVSLVHNQAKRLSMGGLLGAGSG